MESENIKQKNKKRLMLLVVLLFVLTVAVIAIVISVVHKKDAYRLIKIKSFDGSVKIQRENGDVFDAFAGLQLIPEDMVDVDTESFLELLADEDKHICAEENTGFILHASGTSKKGNITIELLYGKTLFTIDKKLNENSSFEVKTPNATMSVRGTTFSVAYDNTKMETTVEVIEGSVLVTANGKEQMLEQGDVITIGADIENVQGMSVDGLGSNGSDQIPVDIYSEDFKEPVFMLTRYYQNVPNYANASAESLEITMLNDSDEEASVTLIGENADTLSPLAESALEIDEQFIEPVMDKVNALFEEKKDQLIWEYSNGNYPEPIDVTEWFDDLENREITVNCADSSYSFAFSKVCIDWIYMYSPGSVDGSYQVYYPLDYIDEDGMQYSILGITFTFY